MFRNIPLLQLGGVLKYHICTIFKDSYIKFKTSTINNTKLFPRDCKKPQFSIKISSKLDVFPPKPVISIPVPAYKICSLEDW